MAAPLCHRRGTHGLRAWLVSAAITTHTERGTQAMCSMTKQKGTNTMTQTSCGMYFYVISGDGGGGIVCLWKATLSFQETRLGKDRGSVEMEAISVEER